MIEIYICGVIYFILLVIYIICIFYIVFSIIIYIIAYILSKLQYHMAAKYCYALAIIIFVVGLVNDIVT